MSTGGIGVTVGSSSTKMTDSGQSISSVGSTVGSVLGNVSMTAGEDLRVQGAEVLAGKDINLTINATGEGNAANSGDIVVQGSQLQAGGDTTLDAARDVLLLGAANTQKTDGSNSSSGGSVGVSLGVSGASSGLSIFANANKGQGSEHGDGTSWTETTLDSGGTLLVHSGRDTSLVGAQVSGETVKVEVGRDLLLQSQQDSDNYDAKQQNSSVGGSFSPGSMTGSISINGSQDKLNSNFDSVQEQTADKNTLDTGTLGFSDIDNQADFKVEHQSVGISTGGNIGSQFVGNMANGLLVGANNEGHADSTTHAAVSEAMRAALLDIRVFMMSIYGVFYQSVEDIDFFIRETKEFPFPEDYQVPEHYNYRRE
ncbi:putative adhesin/hemolysin precursor [Yersinia pseudotuberculosis]|nr:putative adhesin/hemolysin precursor [Yersinia pseudotuberculosis]